MKSGQTTSEKAPVAVTAVYVLTISLFFVGSFFPQARLWGVNVWAHLPTPFRIGLYVLGLTVPAIFTLVSSRHRQKSRRDFSRRTYWWLIGSSAILAAAVFTILRARTHFLGDGYTMLANLSLQNPIIKLRNIGETLIRLGLRSVLTGSSKSAVLHAYQITSIGAGVFFFVVIAWLSGRLFERYRDRLLFCMGLLSCGFSLLFFGYVEHYSLFVPTVGVFLLLGLAAMRRVISRWWLLPPVILAVFFHVFGVFLLPGFVYAIMAPSTFGRALTRLSTSARALLLIVAGSIAAIGYYLIYSSNYYLRFAVLPFVADQFTVQGYTLLAPNHLVDFCNLLMIVLPALPLLITLMIVQRDSKLSHFEDYRFLFFNLFVLLASALIIDPRLGMPRDWDLLSFAGVAPAILLFYYLLDRRVNIRGRSLKITLAITVNLLVLGPRVVTQVKPDLGIARFEDLLRLDTVKGEYGYLILANYYRNHGDPVTAGIVRSRMDRFHPQFRMVNEALELGISGQYVAAGNLAEKALKINPMSWTAYHVLGNAQLYLGNIDSAFSLLTTAAALNPYSGNIQEGLGVAYFAKDQYEKAREHLSRAVEMDSSLTVALGSLASVYILLGKTEKSAECLQLLGKSPNAGVPELKQLAGNYLNLDRYDLASQAYHYALERGMDSSTWIELKQQYPQLK